MTYRFGIIALLAAILMTLVVAPGVAGAADAAATKDAPAATATHEETTAAERRAADSAFEREKLDQDAFATADEEAAGAKREGSSGSGSIFRMIIGLVVVVGAIFGVHWLLKKWGTNRMQGVAGRAGIIDVVATTSLAQGRALHLVRIGDELVLVGATEQSITRIGEFDATALGASSANAGNAEFQAMLTGAMLGSQPGVPVGMGGAGAGNDTFFKRFIDNLRMTTAR